MTFRSTPRTILIVSLALLSLAACNGDGSSTAGIRVISQTTYMRADTPDGEPDAVTDPAQAPSSIKPLYRSDNMYIDLQLGLVKLRVVELLPCSSIVAKAANSLLNFVFPAAHAHAAHIPSGPAGVIDVLKPDLLVWDLGEQGARPGDYCGIRLEIAKLASEPHTGHKPEDGEEEAEEQGVNMAGKAILVSPCYYPDTAGSPRTPLDSETSHSCIEAAYSGEAVTRTLSFAETLRLGERKRGARLMLATHYDTWFDGLDMAALETDAGEQAQLAQNVADSFYVYAVE